MIQKLKPFIPLIVIVSIILLFTAGMQFSFGETWHDAMRFFMAFFFLIFGFFKVINIKGFAAAYRTYDLIAQRSLWYAYAYPFFELALGFAYLFNLYPFITNVATFILMSISAVGVLMELSKGKEITCACLGVVFKIPMTWVTLAEDLLMAGMALAMILTRR
jgi:hypothetical protein